MNRTGNPKAQRYSGGNATIDRLLAEHWPDETLWHVNGPQGRLPITATTEQEAIEIYVRRAKGNEEDDLLVQSA